MVIVNLGKTTQEILTLSLKFMQMNFATVAGQIFFFNFAFVQM